VRWEVELLFKELKSRFGPDEITTSTSDTITPIIRTVVVFYR